MVMSSTSAVAAIIQAVSPASILGALAVTISANAGVATSAPERTSAAQNGRRLFMVSPRSPILSFVMAGLDPAIHAFACCPPSRRGCSAIRAFTPVFDGLWSGMTQRLQRIAIGLAGANAHRVLDLDHENLAVADLAGFGRAGDRLDDAVGAIVRHHDLDLDLGQEVHGVFGAAIDLGVALLAAEALHLGDGEPGDPDLGERVAHVLELERLDDGGDQLHGTLPRALPTLSAWE